MKRRLRIAAYWFAAGFAVLAFAAVGRVTAQDWRTASREPVGIAPDPLAVPEPLVQVYAARAFGWRGLFGVHTWIAVKPAGAGAYARCGSSTGGPSAKCPLRARSTRTPGPRE